MRELPDWLSPPNPNDLYRDGEYVTLDFETTNLDYGSALNPKNRLVLTCWECSWDGKMRYSWDSEFDQQRLLADLERADFLIAHNAKFECQWLDRCGFDIASKPWWDTMLAEWVLSGNRRWRIGLDECLARRNMGGKLDAVSALMAAGVCPSEMPRSLLLRYGMIDVHKTQQLFEDQFYDMVSRQTRLVPVVFTRSQTAPVLADIEKNGMFLDQARVEEEYERTQQEFVEVAQQLDELTGGINPRSTKQVAEYVYGALGFKEKVGRDGEPIRTATGAPKTDEGTLLSLKAKTDEQKKFLELKKRYAQLASALDKNLKLFVGICRERESTLYAQINQGVTVTHRLASSGVPTYLETFEKKLGCQMQNLPRAYKPLFGARHSDWVITELDGSQLEFRVAGHLGRDEMIMRDITEGTDIHRYTASVINSCKPEEVTKAQRTAAKAHTFKPLYGGQSGTKDEQRYYQAFGEKYSGLATTQEAWANQVATHKSLETEWGLIAYWPQARRSRDGYLNVKTNVYNWPVQSLATAEIIPIALVHFWHRTRDMNLLIVNTVHDSIIVEHPEDMLPEVTVVGNQSFTKDVYNYLRKVYNVEFTVPLGTGIKSGKHWSESHFTDEYLGEMLKDIQLDHICTAIDDGEITLEVENARSTRRS